MKPSDTVVAATAVEWAGGLTSLRLPNFPIMLPGNTSFFEFRYSFTPQHFTISPSLATASSIVAKLLCLFFHNDNLCLTKTTMVAPE